MPRHACIFRIHNRRYHLNLISSPLSVAPILIPTTPISSPLLLPQLPQPKSKSTPPIYPFSYLFFAFFSFLGSNDGTKWTRNCIWCWCWRWRLVSFICLAMS
ncbi:hypothetical protein BDW59DRAFT_134653 [Aspergillus cavernicola]|uniref:Uncharacterized protein n=1 Tax=Aspergillus cavernicola TaxID=176166 RepID=A0ABR4HP21_9EURO